MINHNLCNSPTDIIEITNVNRKLIHHVGILLNNDKELSAIEEILLIHIDMNKRKSCPMPIIMNNFNII